MADDDVKFMVSEHAKEKFKERKKDYVPLNNFRDMHWVLAQYANIIINVETGKWYYVIGLSEVGGCHFDLRECWNEKNEETGMYNRKTSDDVVSIGAEELFEKYFFEGIWPVGMCKK